MRFEKGRSGNPGGRPKADGEIRELARKHTAAAIRTLVEIAKHGINESARVAAANAILDRGWGKAAVPALVDVPETITLNFGPALRPPSGDGATLDVDAPRRFPVPVLARLTPDED